MEKIHLSNNLDDKIWYTSLYEFSLLHVEIVAKQFLSQMSLIHQINLWFDRTNGAEGSASTDLS